MRRLLLALLLAVPGAVQAQAPSPPAPALSAPDAWQPRGMAELLVLDKIRAQPTTLQVRTGQSGQFGSLTIAVRGCVTRPPDLPQDSAAFLEVSDSRHSAAGFRGWMLANTPSVSQFEHPLYDVRLVACR